MAQLWKWDSRRGVWHKEDGLDSSGLIPPSDILFSGTTTVPGKLNNAKDYDGLNDFGSVNEIINKCSNDTKGTNPFWIKSINNGAQQAFFSVTTQFGILTDIVFAVDWSSGNDRIRAFCHLDGNLVWEVSTPIGSMTAFNGVYVPVTFSHDEVELSEITIASDPQVITRPPASDSGVWFKGIITDAPLNKANVATFGAVRSLGGVFTPFKGGIDESGSFGEVWDSVDVDAFYNDNNGQEMSEPPPAPPVIPPSPVPIITTHNQDAKNRLLEQYKKETGIEGLIEAYFGTQIQDLEDVLQLFFDRLNIEISEGVQLNGIGKIVNQDRLGLTDELYRLFIRGRIGANVSEGDIERLIEVWKTITQANIVKLEEIFPAEINLATDVALPDNLIDIAFALIQNVSGAGIGVGITTFLPEDAFSFDEADPAITKGFGELISIGTTDGTTANKLVDSGASFDTDGVVMRMIAINDTDGTRANITSVSPTELTLDADIFITGEDYYINANTGGQLAKIQGAN